jgi:hypothetical protein
MAERWTFKKLQELLEYYSGNQKNFKTKRSGRGVIGPAGYNYCVHGYFEIHGAYGGYKLVYVLPYSSAVTEVSQDGFDSARKLADFLYANGAAGLKMRFKELEKRYKPVMKERLERDKKRIPPPSKNPHGKNKIK